MIQELNERAECLELYHEGVLINVALIIDGIQTLLQLPDTFTAPLLLVAGEPTSDKEIIIKLVASYYSMCFLVNYLLNY